MPIEPGLLNLLDLLDVAADAGWSTRRAALALGLDLDRARRWGTRWRAQ